MRTILDTSVVVGSRPPEVPGELAISAVTLAELHYGVLRARSAGERSDRLRRLTAVEREFDALPVDEAVAASYGHLAALLHERGLQAHSPGLGLLVAATAHAHDARVCTQAPEELRDLTGVIEVVTPEQPTTR